MYEITSFNASVSIPLASLPIDPTPGQVREQVTGWVESLKDLPQEDVPVQHEFLDGVYLRTVKMKAGTFVVGKIHKQEHVAIISQGKATVLTEHGVVEIEAPFIFKSPPGSRRALRIHEDMIWTTVHRCDHTDMEKVEEQLIAKDFNDPVLLEFEQKARELLQVRS